MSRFTMACWRAGEHGDWRMDRILYVWSSLTNRATAPRPGSRWWYTTPLQHQPPLRSQPLPPCQRPLPPALPCPLLLLLRPPNRRRQQPLGLLKPPRLPLPSSPLRHRRPQRSRRRRRLLRPLSPQSRRKSPSPFGHEHQLIECWVAVSTTKPARHASAHCHTARSPL